MQPVPVIFSINVYVVVDAGETVGLKEVEVNPDGLLTHEYVCPLVEEEGPNMVLEPIQMDLPPPVFTEGRGLLVTTTALELEQPVIVSFSESV